MKKYKFNIMLLLIILQHCLPIVNAQKLEDDNFFNSADTIFLPHYGQNAVLDSILAITMPNRFQGTVLQRSSVDSDISFYIPVKIWVYHNDNGSNAALNISDVNDLFNGVNTHFFNNNTGIQFYLKCEIEHVYSTKYNTIDNDNEYLEMISIYRDSQALNWHLIRSTNTDWMGRARFPWYDYNFAFAIEYQGVLINDDILTTVHEIGHTLGLLHTHENTRCSGNYNGDASNCCQESVSRSRTQGALCNIGTWGKKKCEVNGDALCDTDAAPNTESNRRITVDNSTNCNYIGGGTDNWGDAWIPPTKNFMSYISSVTCRNEFTWGQIGVMHACIVLYMGTGIYPYPGIDPWYNLNSISLNGVVSSGVNKSYIAPQTIEVANESQYTINSNANINLRAGESIILYSGFHAKSGSSFTAKVGDIPCSSGISLINSATNDNNLSVMTDYYSKKTRIDECSEILLRALNRVGNLEKLPHRLKQKQVMGSNSEIKQAYLYQNAPNPFSQSTRITYYIPNEVNQALLCIYDMQGNQLKQIALSVRGEGSVTVHGSELTAGIYLYALLADGKEVDVKRMILTE
jgi:hypothetical protein